MQKLTNSDLNFVLTRLPKDIIKLLKFNAGKLFVGGGFIRATIAGENVSGIDLFGENKERLKGIANDLTYNRKGRYFETDNAITVLSPPSFPVQFIIRWLFSDGEKLVESFDFTVCQAAIWCEQVKVEVTQIGDSVPSYIVEPDKYKWESMISDRFYSDLAARRLYYTHPAVRDEDAGGSLLRAIKYIKRGYSIQAPSLAGVISRITDKIDWGKIERDSLKSGEKWTARIITGLLREVDPLTLIDGVEMVDEHEVM